MNGEQEILELVGKFDTLFEKLTRDHLKSALCSRLERISYNRGYRLPEIHAEQVSNLLEHSQDLITKGEILDLFLSFHNLTLAKLGKEQSEVQIKEELKRIGIELGFYGVVLSGFWVEKEFGAKDKYKIDYFDGVNLNDPRSRRDLAGGDGMVISKEILGWKLNFEYLEGEGNFKLILSKGNAKDGPFDISILLEKEDLIKRLIQKFGLKIKIFLNAYNLVKSWKYDSIPRRSGNLLTDLIEVLNHESDLTAFKTEEVVKLLTFKISSDNPNITIHSRLLKLVLTEPSMDGWSELKSDLELCLHLLKL